MTLSLSALNIRGVLLDIEGTTTPIAFVFEVLYPFARLHLRDYLAAQLESEEVRADIARLCEERAADLAQNLSPPPLVSGGRDDEIDSIVSYVRWLMDQDRKSTGLKSLQGRIWQQGYRAGTLKSQVFPDVPAALRRWHRAGLKLGIFSSGSVLAQKLLFTHTNAGDLTEFLEGYFDTTVGKKTVAESYRRIAAAMELAPAETLFISDVLAELEASGAADMQTALCIRAGNRPQKAAVSQPMISSFNEITP